VELATGEARRGGSSVPIRLLLADDHQLVRESLRALLEREGYEVVAEAGRRCAWRAS
jgi:CheY-like chemotaxis protein